MIKSRALPQRPASHIRTVGERIRIARKRRGLTLRELAERAGVAPNTLLALERGQPSASIGVLATVLWLLGIDDAFASLADPESDAHGKALELSRAPKRVRKSHGGKALDDF
ncbi:MAG: helix-turn-helix domain-containing protein [Burkholderiaceae bacterium]